MSDRILNTPLKLSSEKGTNVVPHIKWAWLGFFKYAQIWENSLDCLMGLADLEIAYNENQF